MRSGAMSGSEGRKCEEETYETSEEYKNGGVEW